MLHVSEWPPTGSLPFVLTHSTLATMPSLPPYASTLVCELPSESPPSSSEPPRLPLCVVAMPLCLGPLFLAWPPTPHFPCHMDDHRYCSATLTWAPLPLACPPHPHFMHHLHSPRSTMWAALTMCIPPNNVSTTSPAHRTTMLACHITYHVSITTSSSSHHVVDRWPWLGRRDLIGSALTVDRKLWPNRLLWSDHCWSLTMWTPWWGLNPRPPRYLYYNLPLG